jgi:transcriptional regulator with XRE-family HTH domain
VKSFGSRLRFVRLQSANPQTGRPLSQRQLGELLQVEFGVRFSGAAVSDWERGKSKIHADDRLLLVSLIKLLREQGGIQSLVDANELLEAGNYRALNAEESRRVFPETPGVSSNAFSPVIQERRNALSDLNEKWMALLEKAREGPHPAWPRVAAALMRGFADQMSAFGVLHALVFLWLWLATYYLIAPSLRWPFMDRESLLRAVALFCAGTLTLPAFIGLSVKTKDNKFWRETQLSNSPILRLYTHQGAFVGFHVGYFMVFLVFSILNFLRQSSALWFEWALMLVPLFMGYVGAREVPYSLWRAYGRLRLSDGGIFFTFILVGPLWGFFLIQYFSVLTSPFGLMFVLLAITLLVGGMVWQSRKPS